MTPRQAFMTFADTADAVAASSEMIESKMGKSLKKFLTKNIVKKELKDKVRACVSAFVAPLSTQPCCSLPSDDIHETNGPEHGRLSEIVEKCLRVRTGAGVVGLSCWRPGNPPTFEGYPTALLVFYVFQCFYFEERIENVLGIGAPQPCVLLLLLQKPQRLYLAAHVAVRAACSDLLYAPSSHVQACGQVPRQLLTISPHPPPPPTSRFVRSSMAPIHRTSFGEFRTARRG